MKKLLLIRHGKAPHTEEGDLARELNPLGFDQAKLSAEYIKNHHDVGYALVSPTKRTMQTFEIIQGHMGISDDDFEKAPNLYHNNVKDVAYAISTMPTNPDTLLVVGHNPSLLEFAVYCDKDSGDHFHDEISQGLRPAEVIAISFPQLKNWEESLDSQGAIEGIFIPQP